MTRQKKELIRKIEWLERMIEADMELGCGFAPAGAYDDTYEIINGLERELAQLRHYETPEDMYNDPRGLKGYLMDEDIPFR